MPSGSIPITADPKTMTHPISVLTWNINDKVDDKIPILIQLLKKYDVMCLQEHFLSTDKKELLKISPNFFVFLSSAIYTAAHGRPLGGLAIMTTLTCNQIEILAISCLDILIINIYLATNYRNENSDSKFLSACKKVCQLVKKVEKSSD